MPIALSPGRSFLSRSAAAVVLLALAAPAALSAEPGCRLTRKVVGGSAADVRHWPGFAALRLRHTETNISVQFCGATVIARDWLVTAAHCLDDLGAIWRGGGARGDDFARVRLEAVIGVGNLDEVGEANVYPAAAFFQHETYADTYRAALAKSAADAAETAQRVGHDIALVQLARPWDGAIARIGDAAPEASAVAPVPGVMRTPTGIVAGFGATTPRADDVRAYTRSGGQKYYASSPELLEVTLPMVDSKECQAAWPGAAIGEGQLCAGFQSVRGKDSCNGDSGGPLVVLDDKLCPSVVGVVSWGASPCAVDASAYSVYTRLEAHRAWIDTRVGGLKR